jgi:hypothetical protein
MSLSEDDVQQAEKRLRARLQNEARAISARYDKGGARIVIALSNGLELAVPVELVQGLSGARSADLNQIEISPTGHGLHWPRLDADLYLPALLQGVFGTRRWMAQVLGKTGGQARSSAKAAASRANGKRGGRPRKDPSR